MRNRIALARSFGSQPGAVYHVPSDRQVEPLGRFDLGMSGKLFDLIKTKPLGDPVAQTSPAKIVERSILDGRQPSPLRPPGNTAATLFAAVLG
jgi:hypothetical protein